MKKRTRNKQIWLAFTASEAAKFDGEYLKTRYRSRADFILALLDSKPVVVVESLTATLVELKRQGNNLNQIVRLLHSGGQLPDEDIARLTESWIAAYDSLTKLEGRITDAIVQSNGKQGEAESGD